LEEQNQKLSSALDAMTANRDALVKEKEAQERSMERMRLSIDGKNAALASHRKAEQAKGARMGGQRAKRHTTIVQPSQRRTSSFRKEDL
jgi:hypothetical protein